MLAQDACVWALQRKRARTSERQDPACNMRASRALGTFMARHSACQTLNLKNVFTATRRLASFENNVGRPGLLRQCPGRCGRWTASPWNRQRVLARLPA